MTVTLTASRARALRATDVLLLTWDGEDNNFFVVGITMAAPVFPLVSQ